MDEPGGAAARRAALDHVLGLIAAAPWSELLVLRGSMVMPAWAGERAREPADLDFVVLPELRVPVDPLAPYPYLDRVDLAQEWPEALGGAAQYEIWSDGAEEYETRGLRPRVPPEGLYWEVEPAERPAVPPYDDLIERIRQQPQAPAGVLLDVERAAPDRLWGYIDDYWYDGGTGDGVPGVRVRIPWHTPGGRAGELQLDFALDERLPRPPVWTLIPRADGGAPTLIRTASRELSLAWKLLWLYADAASGDGPQPKDLYDAVLLAEDPRTRLTPALLRTVLRKFAAETPGGLSVDESAWARFRAAHPNARGSARSWAARLGDRVDGITARAAPIGRR
ncbi:nucleotidyl transferase AbiEii/AbiGii toxin family protein [Streptomyces indicus]|uniref:Nucleotidyl transferase AbiEii toxin, Type IV TA system n=1 Tax=Streptomyces indicus TaxID=417292 RepID=A0A1G8V2C5_9ACTN|nr:nucleotidyl transferase AbiEii/AbiGii toxin family protein [Streptomyces indicus]SDJ60014.1 Nucleotidyl transferase AbiEii toxin, Type IV TA system [Streptomyces indicus]